MSTSILWLRRDLRLGDHPALLAAADAADAVLPVFVVDPALADVSGDPRLAFLWRSLRDLQERLDGRLVVRRGDPAQVVPALAREVAATSVHVSADFGPYGTRRDEAVEDAVPLVRTGSPYAVAPGRVRKDDGTPFKVFTPFFRAWQRHGWRAPADSPGSVRWTSADLSSDPVPPDPDLGETTIPAAGEQAARDVLEDFLRADVQRYADRRDLPGVPGTSRLSVYLKYGCIHPRTVLAALDQQAGEGAQTFRSELAWREFYADVLSQRPDSAREHLNHQLDGLHYDAGERADQLFDAWAYGRTGYPIVDAGMRQLLAEAWMHNRVRMITASFLVKDLHISWLRGAQWFMQHLVDGDLASNNHGWQWVAGSGTDASPYFRVFNPTTQGLKFDASGDYIRRWVPELREVAGKAVHEPWTLPGGPPNGYPQPVVEHKAEREEALRRYAAATGK